MSAVITNSSLTGNEKRDFAMFVMKRLTEQQRQIVEAAFDTSEKKIIKEESTQKNAVRFRKFFCEKNANARIYSPLFLRSVLSLS